MTVFTELRIHVVTKFEMKNGPILITSRFRYHE